MPALAADDFPALRDPARRGRGLRRRRRPRGIQDRARHVDLALAYHEAVGAALAAIESCPHPTVAAILGPCVGGGLEIACACDLRIAGEGAKFGAPIMKLGFSMYPGELAGFLKLAGPALAKEILLEGRLLSAAEAYAKGLLTRVVADDAVGRSAGHGTTHRRRGAAGGALAQAVDRAPDGRPAADARTKSAPASPSSTRRTMPKAWPPSSKSGRRVHREIVQYGLGALEVGAGATVIGVDAAHPGGAGVVAERRDQFRELVCPPVAGFASANWPGAPAWPGSRRR
jgi:enoyl-CoA hydratase/carnithine racemase